MRRYAPTLLLLSALAAFLLGRLSVDGGLAWGMGRTTSPTRSLPPDPGSNPSSSTEPGVVIQAVYVVYPTATPLPPTPSPIPTARPTADRWDLYDPQRATPGLVYRMPNLPAPTATAFPACDAAPPGKLCVAPTTTAPDDGATDGGSEVE